MKLPTLPIVFAYVDEFENWTLRTGDQKPPKGFAPAWIIEYGSDPRPSKDGVPPLPSEEASQAKTILAQALLAALSDSPIEVLDLLKDLTDSDVARKLAIFHPLSTDFMESFQALPALALADAARAADLTQVEILRTLVAAYEDGTAPEDVRLALLALRLDTPTRILFVRVETLHGLQSWAYQILRYVHDLQKVMQPA